MKKLGYKHDPWREGRCVRGAFTRLTSMALAAILMQSTPALAAEDEDASLGDFLLSAAEDAAKSKGKELLSNVGQEVLDIGLAYIGLDGILGGKDPFATHAAKILNAIEAAKEEVIDHIDDRWDAQTYADASAAIKKLNQWEVLTLTERADQVPVAADLFDAFASVLGRYEADVYAQRRFDLLHEYAAVADVTASLAVDWIRLSVLASATADLRTALTAEWHAAGMSRSATVEDAIRAMSATARADLESRLRQATKESINAILLGTNSTRIGAAANLVGAVASISAGDMLDLIEGWMSPIRVGTSFIRADGRWQSEWFYDMTAGSSTTTLGIREIKAGTECSRTNTEYYGQWDGWSTNWTQSWMFPECGRGDLAFTLPWGVPFAGHVLALAVHIYTPVRLLLEKWWQLAGHAGARPYNELDDITDMYIMDLHAEHGGDVIEAFAHAAPDGAPLRIDRSYANPSWKPPAVWDRVMTSSQTRQPSGAREKTRALVDIALRFGADGAVDFLEAVHELDALRSAPATLDETIRHARTGMSPEEYRGLQKGVFAAKFVAIM